MVRYVKEKVPWGVQNRSVLSKIEDLLGLHLRGFWTNAHKISVPSNLQIDSFLAQSTERQPDADGSEVLSSHSKQKFAFSGGLNRSHSWKVGILLSSLFPQFNDSMKRLFCDSLMHDDETIREFFEMKRRDDAN
jgi:hypothetical protein